MSIYTSYEFWYCLIAEKSVIILNWLLQIVKFLSILIPLLLAVAFLTLIERKVLATMQLRKGPTNVGYLGLLQPIVDGVKLILKELVLPVSSNKFILLLSPIWVLSLSFLAWIFIPLGPDNVLMDSDLGLLYIFAISSLSVYGIIMAGWASNSRYAFLGALRSAAQMISYEVSIGLTLISILLVVGSANLTDIVMFQEHVYFIVPFWPLALVFFISILAETSRPPFDLPEAEGELVAGYNVEFSAVGFAMFFIGEYANIILMSTVFTILFLGGWVAPSCLDFIDPSLIFIFKINCTIYVFLWARASLPRFRYDQLMYLGWKVLLPISLVMTILTSLFLVLCDALPI